MMECSINGGINIFLCLGRISSTQELIVIARIFHKRHFHAASFMSYFGWTDGILAKRQMIAIMQEAHQSKSDKTKTKRSMDASWFPMKHGTGSQIGFHDAKTVFYLPQLSIMLINLFGTFFGSGSPDAMQSIKPSIFRHLVLIDGGLLVLDLDVSAALSSHLKSVGGDPLVCFFQCLFSLFLDSFSIERRVP